jgi:hypothetical protein
MIKGSSSFFNVPFVYVGNMYHVVYRNDESRELIVAIRSPLAGIDWVNISSLIRQAQEDGIVAKGALSPDFNVDYWTGWDTILAFDLAPCIELYIKEKWGKSGQHTYGYKVITP